MNQIVNNNLMMPFTSNISSTYVQEPSTGAGLAAGMQSFAQGIQTAMQIANKQKAQAAQDAKASATKQAALDLAMYEQDVADLYEAKMSSGMSDTETVARLGSIQRKYSHVPASDRNQVDARYMMNISRNLYESSEKNALEAQHAAEKEQVENYRKQFPGIFNNLSWEESVSKSKEMQQNAGILANLAAGVGDKAQYSNEMYLSAAKNTVVDDMYNWLGQISAETPITAQNIGDIELRLQSAFVSQGIDARIATLATQQVLQPYKNMIQNYTDTQKVSAGAIKASVTSRLSPLAMTVLDNPQFLSMLPVDTAKNIEAELVKEMAAWTPEKASSVTDLMSYKNYGTTSKGVSATQTSYNMGFAIMTGASSDDSEMQRNMAVSSAGNLRKQINFKEDQEALLPVSLNGQSFMDAQAAYNNNTKITDGEIGMLEIYSDNVPYRKERLVQDIRKGVDLSAQKALDLFLLQKYSPNPATRAAAEDINRQNIQAGAKSATDLLYGDIDSFLRTDTKILFDEEKGDIRVFEKLRKGEVIDRFRGRIVEIGGKKWMDVTDTESVAGLGEATQASFKSNRDYINKQIARFCDASGYSKEECENYRKDVWRAAAEPYASVTKTTETDVSGILAKGAERTAEVVGTVSSAPFVALGGTGYAVGEGLAKAKILGDKVDAAALEGLKMAGEGAEDLGNKVISSSKELFQKAAEGAGDVGEKVGNSVAKPVMMLGGVGYTLGELAASNETSDKTLGNLLAGLSEQLKKGKDLVKKETPESLSEVLLGLKSTLKGLIDNAPDGMTLLLPKEDAEALGEIWTNLGLEVNDQFHIDENGNVAILKESLQTMYELAEVATDLEYEEEYIKTPYFDTQGIPTVGIGFNMETLANRLEDVKKYAPGFYEFMTEEVVNKIKEYASVRKDKNATAETIAAKKKELESALDDVYIDKREADLLLHKFMIDAYKEAKSSSKVKPYWDKLSQSQRKFFTKTAYNAGIGNIGGFNKMHEALQSSDSYKAAIEFLSSKLPAQTKGRSLKLATELLDWDAERSKQALEDYKAGKREGDAGVLETLFKTYTEFFKKHKKPGEKDRNPAEDLRQHLYK